MEPPAEQHTIAGLFARLVDDAERFARAEVRLYRAQFLGRVDSAKFAILAAVSAAVIGQASVVALLVGLLMVLRRPLGPAWATIIVVGGALMISGILVKFALSGLGKATKIEAEDE